jgi:hypothetical protein
LALLPANDAAWSAIRPDSWRAPTSEVFVTGVHAFELAAATCLVQERNDAFIRDCGAQGDESDCAGKL